MYHNDTNLNEVWVLDLIKRLECLRVRNTMPICHECNISVDPEWTICPTCSVALQPDGSQPRRQVPREERYASNLAWYFHLIPVVTGVLTLAVGDYLVSESDPLLRTIFPPFCLIVGGWLGLILLGIISSYVENP